MKHCGFWQTLRKTVISLYILLTSINQNSAHPSSKVVNPHPFKYILNNEALCEKRPDTLIWIHTAPSHIRHRMFLRDTWANPSHFRKRKVTLVFFLGLSLDDAIQDMIEYESETYHDIVQESFVDSYRNLTYKAMAGCRWMSTFCQTAKLVLKADDDMVVDVYLLFRHIESLQAKGRVLSNTILCDVWYGRYPERVSGKWNVSMAEFSEKVYPPYCPGLGIVMTGDIVGKLFYESLFEPYFWVDDVYFTGLLARTINATFEQLSSTVHFGSSRMVREQTIFKNQYQWIFYHIHERPIARMMWNMIYQREIFRLNQGLSPSA
ncbi:beta-1,3-galactosyltransferase 1-like [Watersipora subatra]|uniref:beta-1,3-galactosyltransferase 1-like n=1 Tax=Watersipora subatra TaxID=2589382 RepID=UPI00355BE1A7